MKQILAQAASRMTALIAASASVATAPPWTRPGGGAHSHRVAGSVNSASPAGRGNAAAGR